MPNHPSSDTGRSDAGRSDTGRSDAGRSDAPGASKASHGPASEAPEEAADGLPNGARTNSPAKADSAKAEAPDEDGPPYVDTEYGLLTATGQWYRVREADLRDYAGEVLERVSLEKVLALSDAWLRSPRVVAAWGLLAALAVLPAGWAALTAAGAYVGWTAVHPLLAGPLVARASRALENALVQGAGYAVALSALGTAGALPSVGAGLAGFLLLRWGVVDWAAERTLLPLVDRAYPLPAADQVLRGLLIRIAVRRNLTVPQVEGMRRSILDRWGSSSD
jgi:hypothetical protein